MGRESSVTSKPAASAAFDSRKSAHTKGLLAGRCWHHVRAAASCMLSAARNSWLSRRRIARSRNASPGRISLQPRPSKASRDNAPCFSAVVIIPRRCSRAMALCTSTGLPHHTTGIALRKWDSARRLVISRTHKGTSALESQKSSRFTHGASSRSSRRA